MKNRKVKNINWEKKTIFKWSGIVSIVLIAIMVISLLVVKGTKAKNDFVVYVKNEELFFSGLSGKDSWQVSQNFMNVNEDEDAMIESAVSSVGDYIQVSRDGSTIFFVDKMEGSTEGYTIWYRKIDGGKAEAVKLDTGITLYKIDDAGKVVTYVKGGTLYQSNLDKKEKIESDIKDLRVSKDGKKIVYMNSDYGVYWKELGKDSKKIASDVTNILHTTEDCSAVYYTKQDAIYKKDVNGDAKKLFSDVYRVVKIYETGEIYYLEEKSIELNLKEYVVDDMKEEDANMVEPEFPSAVDFSTDEEYLAAYDAYEKKMGDVCDKEFRDELRRELNNSGTEHITYNLCYYDGSKKKQIMENVVDDKELNDSNCAEEKPTILLSAYIAEEIEKIKISDVVGVDELKETITGKLNGTKEWYVANGEKCSKIKYEDGTGFMLSKEGDRIFFVNRFSQKKQQGELCKVDVTKKGLGKVEKYDSNVCYALFLEDGKLAYYKNLNQDGQKASLYVDGNKVANKVDVGSATAVAENGKVIYITNWDYEKENGTLHVFDGKKTKVIAKNIHRFEVLPNGKVIYMKDYSSKTYSGDLYIWDTRKIRKIDEDVQAVIKIRRYED